MAQVNTKKKPKKRRVKTAKRYRKPKTAIGVMGFNGRTYTEARVLVGKLLDKFYAQELVKDCGNNISEMARRADLTRTYVRRLLRKAGLQK